MPYINQREILYATRSGMPVESGLDRNGIRIEKGDTVTYEPTNGFKRILDHVEGCKVEAIFSNGRVNISHPSFIDGRGINHVKTTSRMKIFKTS